MLAGPKEAGLKACGDVLVVAHGHILRAFALRWAGQSLERGPTFLMEAGGVGTLRWAQTPPKSCLERSRVTTSLTLVSYEHHNVGEPAILLGGAFVGALEG